MFLKNFVIPIAFFNEFIVTKINKISWKNGKQLSKTFSYLILGFEINV